MDGRELFLEKRQAGSDLGGLRIAVFRRAALYNVGDIDLFTGEVNGLDDAGQELPGLADKGPPLQVFVPARGLADKAEGGGGVPLTEDDALSPLMEPAAGALPELLPGGVEAGERRYLAAGEEC